MHDDFVDLRGGHLNSESFWPSFTDIMMVVVMIFLLTSTILMVRNWELIDQLRNSIMAEQQATEIIKFTSQENATLEEQLANAQNEISLLRVQLMQASEQTQSLQDTLTGKDKQIIIMTGDNQKLQNTLSDADRKITNLSVQTKQLQNDIDTLRVDSAAQAADLKASRDKIIILGQEKDANATILANLESSYGELKVKYDKLVKPARTAKGKHVVEVNYQRIKGVERIRFKGINETKYSNLSSKQLHTSLAKAKKEHPKTLYIKIVIPKESGLSYSEAWTFMKDLLEKYDYYYQ